MESWITLFTGLSLIHILELYEKAGNAQLAREIDAALPIELSCLALRLLVGLLLFPLSALPLFLVIIIISTYTA